MDNDLAKQAINKSIGDLASKSQRKRLQVGVVVHSIWVSPEHAWIGLAISSILSQVWTISILPNLALSTNWAQWTTFTNLCSFLFLKSVRELVRYYNGSEFHASCLENPQTMEASLDFKISPFLCFLISFCYQYFSLEDLPLEYAAYLTRCYYVPLFY